MPDSVLSDDGCEDTRVSLPEALALAADALLIRAAIDASGLSARRFAVDILTRDERTVRRWLRGDNPLPRVVRSRLEAILANMGSPERPP